MITGTMAPDYASARLAATEYRMIDRVRQKLLQQRAAWERYGIVLPPDLAGWFDEETAALDRMRVDCVAAVRAAWKDTDIAAFVDGTPGLGPMLLVVLSLTPELDRFANPAKLWRYVGLHAGRAAPMPSKDGRTRGMGYNPQLKAWLLWRLAEPCVKLRASPYRAVYDRARDKPEMLPAGQCMTCDAAYAKRKATGKGGWDCANMGGPHWKPAHARTHALGVTAKAILRDAWRVARGMEPKYAGNG